MHSSAEIGCQITLQRGFATAKEEQVKMLNQGLELEHAARIQYLAHAEQVDRLNAEPIIARLKEIADDERKHEEMFRELIGGLSRRSAFYEYGRNTPSQDH